MTDTDWLARRFEEHRSRLTAVAYRMLGSAPEAEDAVQETWLRLSRTETSDIENLGGWITTVIGRVCLTMLKTRQLRREEPLGEHGPELEADPESEALLADSVGVALVVVLDTLRPAERLAFVLHDIFGVPFGEIAGIVDCTPTAARQLASRARRRVRGISEVSADMADTRAVVDAFLAASREGDFDALIALLAADVVFRADHAAVRAGANAEIRGPVGVIEAFTGPGRAEALQRALVDGTPGAAVAPQGWVWAVFTFSVRDGRIAEIELIGDPTRLDDLDVVLLSR
jgi:RNA polymerase sigma factor (sigma-70 family)